MRKRGEGKGWGKGGKGREVRERGEGGEGREVRKGVREGGKEKG